MTLSALTLAKGTGSGISTTSRIRATVSAKKSALARNIRLLAVIRALFSASGFAALRLM